jgi:ubiquinol-cytochrome c reductase cytochrome c subunit
MRVPALAAGLLAALLATTAAAADPPRSGIVHVPRNPSLVEQGYQLYGGNCASCHGSRGAGILAPAQAAGEQKGLGPRLRGVGAQSADFYLRTGYMPLEHVGAQPTRSRVLFSDREIRALVAYVASLRAGPAVPQVHPELGSQAEGLQLFTDHCAGCHQVVAEGGIVTGAHVPLIKEQVTPVQIAESVRIGPYLMPRFSRKQISDRELDSIIAYLQAMKDPPDPGGWGIGHVGPVPEGVVTWLIAAVSLAGVCALIGERRKR